MKIDDVKKTETDVENILEQMDSSHKIVMYKTLYNSGYRISNVEDDLRKIKEYTPLKQTFNPQEGNPFLYGIV